MEVEEVPSRHGAAVDMTTLDITYITHRLLGEVFWFVFIFSFSFPSMTVVCFKVFEVELLQQCVCARVGGVTSNEPPRPVNTRACRETGLDDPPYMLRGKLTG